MKSEQRKRVSVQGVSPSYVTVVVSWGRFQTVLTVFFSCFRFSPSPYFSSSSSHNSRALHISSCNCYAACVLLFYASRVGAQRCVLKCLRMCVCPSWARLLEAGVGVNSSVCGCLRTEFVCPRMCMSYVWVSLFISPANCV